MAVLFALPDEYSYFGERNRPAKRTRQVWGGGIAPAGRTWPLSSAFAYRIGVGPDHAYRNTGLLLQGVRSLRAVIVAGFAGGLKAGLQPGCVVVATQVFDAISQQSYVPDAALAAAVQVELPGVRVAHGLLASADRVLVYSADKAEFAGATGAIAVDMETAGAAAAAQEHGTPWLAVRVITDGVDDDLPFDFNALKFQAHGDPYGGVDRGRIAAEALLHPSKLPALIRLGMRSNIAARNLAAFLHALLHRIP